jgi:hypothetical protein
VPYLWGTNGIGYNVDKVKAVLGIDHIDSWAVLFEPENLKKLKQCGVAIMDSADELFPAVLNYMGMDPRSENRGLQEGRSQAAELRPYITYFHSSKYVSDLANGDICVAFGYSGDVFQAANRAKEAKNGVNIAYSIPKEGSNLWFDLLAIPKDASNPSKPWRSSTTCSTPSDRQGQRHGRLRQRQPGRQGLHGCGAGEQPRGLPAQEVLDKLYISTTPSPRSCAMTRSWSKVKSNR